MIDQSHANTIQPATTPEDILADSWIREKVDKGMTDDTEHVDLDFVSIGLKAAICRPESRANAGNQIEAEFSRACVLEQAIRRPGIQTRDQIEDWFRRTAERPAL